MTVQTLVLGCGLAVDTRKWTKSWNYQVKELSSLSPQDRSLFCFVFACFDSNEGTELLLSLSLRRSGLCFLWAAPSVIAEPVSFINSQIHYDYINV